MSWKVTVHKQKKKQSRAIKYEEERKRLSVMLSSIRSARPSETQLVCHTELRNPASLSSAIVVRQPGNRAVGLDRRYLSPAPFFPKFYYNL